MNFEEPLFHSYLPFYECYQLVVEAAHPYQVLNSKTIIFSYSGIVVEVTPTTLGNLVYPESSGGQKRQQPQINRWFDSSPVTTSLPHRIDPDPADPSYAFHCSEKSCEKGYWFTGDDFPEQLAELRGYFDPLVQGNNYVKAVPGEGLNIPIWLLGSSGFNVQLAGELGLPFAFAGHFSPHNTLPALKLISKFI